MVQLVPGQPLRYQSGHFWGWSLQGLCGWCQNSPLSYLVSHFCWQDRSEDTESEQGGFVTCRAVSPGSTQGLIGYYRDLLSDHNLPSLSHFSPGKRLGFTGPTGLWASEISLATASLSDPCCICAPSQSLGVQDEEGCWHCDLAVPSGWGWDVEQAGTLVSPSLQVRILSLYCVHMYKYVFLLPQVFATLVNVWGQVPWMQSLREGFPCTGFIIGEQDEAGEVHQACDLSWRAASAWLHGELWAMKCTIELSHLEARDNLFFTPLTLSYCQWGWEGAEELPSEVALI